MKNYIFFKKTVLDLTFRPKIVNSVHNIENNYLATKILRSIYITLFQPYIVYCIMVCGWFSLYSATIIYFKK